MTTPLHEIERQAQELDAEERAKLAEILLESLRKPVSELESAWAEEIESRVAAFNRGDTPTVSAEEVFAEARSLSHY